MVGLAAGAAIGRELSGERVRFARSAGSSIATPGAAGWMTDFLNAAYYRKPAAERELDDLRLAHAILTTFWWRKGERRLRALDVASFHRCFGRARFISPSSGARGTLSREALTAGADALLGEWFSAAATDPRRNGWGIVFGSEQGRSDYEPERRLRLAPLGRLTPGEAPASAQTWHTYEPVALGSAEAAVAFLTQPARWPELTTEIGRFTPLRNLGLLGQTFEIEVTAGTASGRPVFQRGYVTITRLATGEDPEDLRRYVQELEHGLATYGHGESRAVPEGAEPIAAFDLSTHEGHFMGHGKNRLLIYRDGTRSWVRAAGTWDPMPWHLDQVYRLAGREAQHACWGEHARERQSMLHQLAVLTGS